MTPKMAVIGLTGPTGAGKGEAAAQLKALGIPVVDADRLARQVTKPGHPCLQELVQAFSPAILRADGSLNRPALAQVFTDKKQTEKLNAVTHPHIIALIREQLEQYERAGARLAVIDAPLLFESGLDGICTRTAAVIAPSEERLRRILLRDGLTRQEGLRRMHAQPEDDYYIACADDILYNTGTREAFALAAREWAKGLLNELKEV